jgi:hypothetical protein
MKIKRNLFIVSMLFVFAFAFTAYSSVAAESAAQNERQLKMTLDDKDVIYATLLDTPAANIFVERLPFTLAMTDYISRNKRGSLPFVIAAADLHNIQYPFETGDVIYYPPGPLLGLFYDHNGAEISAGFELIARMDQAGIKTLATYPGNVKVTVELNK